MLHGAVPAYAGGQSTERPMPRGAAHGPKDPMRVNLDDSDEVFYWIEALGCTPVELGRAVHAVGPLAERVRHYLERQKPPANDPTV